ncbi:MAG: hypothetical protein U0637_01200 [Phycisphaerales bacterium]
MKRNRTSWVVAALAGGAMMLGALHAPMAMAHPAPAPLMADDSKDGEQDTLVMTSGQELKGKILAETPTTIKFRLVMGGISTDLEYPRSQIKEVRRAKAGGDKPEAPAADAKAETPQEATADTDSSAPTDIVPVDGRTRYYYAELTGRFGEDITQTMIRRVLKDAQKQKTDVMIFYLDATWRMRDDIENKDLPDDVNFFDAIFRAEDILPMLVEEVPREWDKAPKMVFWVRNAMGGAAMLPVACPNIYMHPEGRIGGLGDLSFIFGSTGDEVVRQKQRSLRLGHAKGWMHRGGYDERIMSAMAQAEYVLSMHADGSLFEGYPQSPSDELLTDDGEKDNLDTLEQRVRGEGNDVLTLKPRNARLMGVSKGTVETKDDLLATLDLTSNAVDVGVKSKKITEGWKEELSRTRDQLKRLWRDYREVRVQQPGEYQQRTAARGKRRGILKQMKNILERYKEALTPPFFQENEFPADSADKVIEWITYADEQIWIEQQKDKK